MKQKLLLTLSVATMLVLTGCGKKANSSSEEKKKVDSVTFNLPSMNTGAKEGGYNITIPYSDSYFEADAKKYDKDLSMLSFGASMSTGSKGRVQSFYSDLEFDKFVASNSYDATPTETSVGYAFAHKTIGNADLVAVTIRGLEYGMEWVDNTNLGLSGNHAGFEARAQEILSSLESYMNANVNKTPKLWINGYSRGAAIANVLSDNILKANFKSIAQENMYVYTFESPRGVDSEKAGNWANVHNIINSADLVTYIAPEAYGLSRCGVDIDIYDSNVSTLLKSFDSDIEMPEFIEDTSWKTDQEVVSFNINRMLQEFEEENSMTTREQFMKNYQADIGYALGIVFSMNDLCKAAIVTAFQNLSGAEMFALLGEDGLYNFLKPFLDQYHVPYEDTKLKNACNTLLKGISGPLSGILGTFLSSKETLMRVIAMHYTDTVYVLLKNYNSKIQVLN